MSFSRLRRRASIVAIGTMLAALTLIGFYSHAVQKGVLPSPAQPFVADISRPVLKQTPSPVAVSARSAAPALTLPTKRAHSKLATQARVVA